MSQIFYIDNIKKALKYILMSFISFTTIRYIPNKMIDLKLSLIISAIISIFFSILDIISPNIKIITTSNNTPSNTPKQNQL